MENSLVFHVIFLSYNSHGFVIGVTLNDILDWFLVILETLLVNHAMIGCQFVKCKYIMFLRSPRPCAYID